MSARTKPMTSVEEPMFRACVATGIEVIARCFRSGMDLNGEPNSDVATVRCLRDMAEMIEKKLVLRE